MVGTKNQPFILLGFMHGYDDDLIITQISSHAFLQRSVMVIIMRNLYVPIAKVKHVYEFYNN